MPKLVEYDIITQACASRVGRSSFPGAAMDRRNGCTDDSTLRLGEFLVCLGAMTEEQVSQVLDRQKSEPDRLFGQIAIELGFINESAVDRFLAAKSNP